MENTIPAVTNGFVVKVGDTSPAFETITSRGVTLLFKAVSADTNGQLSVLEYHAPALFPGAPMHWHKKTVESFYILEGRLAMQVGDEEIMATAGQFVVVPPCTLHRWRNPDDTPMKFLILFSPGGFEAYFKELVETMATEPSWPPADMAKYYALGERFDSFEPPVTM